MNVPQPLPSDDTLGGKFARELALLLGPAYQPSDGTLIAADLLTIGDSLGDVYTTQQNALNQVFPNSADVCLPDWETRLDVPTNPSLSNATRQAHITAKRRATGGGDPSRVLAAAQAIDPTASISTTKAPNAAVPRAVFQWAIAVSAAIWADTNSRAAILAAIRQMQPAYARCAVTVTAPFHFDDPNSQTGRDVYG